MSDPKYIVGIDLGTTHCVLAYTAADVPEDVAPEIHLLEIPQVVEAGEVKAQPLLPSFLFLPGPHDVAEGGLALPWNPEIDYAVGEFARSRGAELPARQVASAKSWLCHSGVDRTQEILPWDAPADARRLSPLDATARYLEHLARAWNHQMADAEAPLEDQLIFLTVPASFDVVARELTLEAQKDALRDHINVGKSILFCNIGGGTTDFSLIQVTEEKGSLDLQRAAVGHHLLLGGDNMDLTLAYAVRAKLAQDGAPLDTWQFRSLWHSCRQAKERLLNNPDLDAEPVVILGRGAALIGGTIRTELTRQEIDTILVGGFFPECKATDYPEKKPRVGMREMGLPYESDPAITRHLAQFLGRHASGGKGGVAFPSAVLFNGGVMKATALREQVLAVLQSWNTDGETRELASVDLDRAVALGATYYGLPGIPTPMKALCVAPFGMEEGSDAEIREKEFGLVVGDSAVFHLLATTTRKNDQAGEIVEDWSGEIQEVATMETQLEATDAGGTVIPVWLQSKVTEIGTLELWCVARDDDRRWKLEFNIREQQEA